MSFHCFCDGVRWPRAITKRELGTADGSSGASTGPQVPGPSRDIFCMADLEQVLCATIYACPSDSLFSEVHRLLCLPKILGLPSGPAFQGSQVAPEGGRPRTGPTREVVRRQQQEAWLWTMTTHWRRPPLVRQPPSPSKGCAFCRANGERREFYMGHGLRDRSTGGTWRVTCPVLRKYKCPRCGYPGGDQAHTLRYCPLNRKGGFRPTVYNTPLLSNGRRRRFTANRGDSLRRDKMRWRACAPRLGSTWPPKAQSHATGP